MADRDDTPWEPPLAGDEVGHLLGALDRLRWTFRWKADGLDEAGLRTTLGSSALTIGGLLKHLALVEDRYAAPRSRGEPLGEPWASAPDDERDWDFTSAVGDAAPDLYGLYDAAVERCRATFTALLADGDLGQPVHLADENGNHASLRRLVCDLVEEYGRHTGHADLIRESIDGLVGEDPPPGWRPVSA